MDVNPITRQPDYVTIRRPDYLTTDYPTFY
jgi:hypothetical protein